MPLEEEARTGKSEGNGIRAWVERLLPEIGPGLEALSREELFRLVRDLQARRADLENHYDEILRLSPREIRRLFQELDDRRLRLEETTRELGQARDYYFNLFESSPAPCFITNGEHLVLKANGAAAALLDLDMDQIVGQDLARFVEVASAPDSGKSLPDSQPPDRGFLTVSVRRRDGSRRYGLLQSRPVSGAGEWQIVFLPQNPDGSLSQPETLNRACLDQLINSKLIGVVTGDFEGRIHEANDAFLDIVGYSREDLKAGRLNWRAITPEEYAAQDEKVLQNLLTDGFFAPVEKENIRKDGSRVAIYIGGALWERDPPTWICFALDITERKRSERESESLLAEVELQKQKLAENAHILQKERDLLQVIMENAGASLIYLDCNLNVIKINSACARMFGGTVNELIGRNYFDLFGDRDRAMFEHVRATGQTMRFHDRPSALAGSRARKAAYWDWTLTPVKDPSGAVQGLVLALADNTERRLAETALQSTLDSLEANVAERTAVLASINEELSREIVERRKAEEALRQKENSLRLILGQMPTVVWTTDRHLTVDWLAGTPLPPGSLGTEEAVGRHIFKIYGTDEPEHVAVKAHRLALAGTPARYERQVGEATIYAYVEPLRDAGGDIIGVIGVANDITERKRVEDELRNLYRRLVTVQENERRAIARELHDQVSQSLAFLKLLLDRAMSRPDRKLEFGFDEARSLVTELISQVRNLSLDLRPKILDDLGLLPTLLWHFERYTAQTGIKVSFRHARLRQGFTSEVSTAAYRIVQEALSNVARHADVNKVAVRVWSDGSRLSIKVADLGAGFDLGERGTASSGLSGMRERASALGGTFEVKTAPGAGTLILARLPLPA